MVAMSDRTQTLSVEFDVSREHAERFAAHRGSTGVINQLVRKAVARALSQPEHQGDEHWGPVTIRRDEDGELHLESPYRRLDSFDGPAEQFWPASVARFQGESAEHWHTAAAFWQEKAEAQPPAEEIEGLREEAYCIEEFLRKVTQWKGSAEDELTEAIEAAQKLTAVLDPPPQTPGEVRRMS